MYIYYIFNNIDNLVGKLLTYVCDIFFVSILIRKIAACRKKSTDDTREESITKNHEEEPITEES